MTEVVTISASQRRKFGYKREPYKLNSPVVFPPCRVCGGKSSGFHFGVITCEACKVGLLKVCLNLYTYMHYDIWRLINFLINVLICHSLQVFFRRTMATKEKETFKCRKNEQCLITQCLYSNKAPCSACRLEKCLSLGMSRQSEYFLAEN